jgi:hypothetical protein
VSAFVPLASPIRSVLDPTPPTRLAVRRPIASVADQPRGSASAACSSVRTSGLGKRRSIVSA